MLVAVTAVSGVMTMFSPTSTPAAQANVHGECVAANGQAHVHSPLFAPGVPGGNSPHSASFFFHFDPVLTECTGSLTDALSAVGTVHGHCGLSSGSGVTSGGTSFGWVGVGTELVLSGGLSGTVNAAANTAQGSSCITGARSFIITGAVVHHSCKVASLPPTSVPGTKPTNHHHCV